MVARGLGTPPLAAPTARVNLARELSRLAATVRQRRGGVTRRMECANARIRPLSLTLGRGAIPTSNKGPARQALPVSRGKQTRVA